MKPRYIGEFTEGSRVDALFVVRAKEVRSARTGDTYLSLELADRTGAIPAVCFRPARLAVEIPIGAVVSVKGAVTSYRGTRRLVLESIRPAESWDANDFVAAGNRPAEELVAEFKELVRSVTHAGLRALIREVFGDASFFKRFCRCPGSQTYHHAYAGGLLEHTNAVATYCSFISSRNEDVDRDLLVAAALLHDVGKVEELAFDLGIGYSDAGRLVGHVVLGVGVVQRAAERTGLDRSVLLRLEHAVLSHHGELEWGSPKRPSTLEALVLHHVDNLDAKAAGFARVVNGATRGDETWTDAANLFRRPLYAPRPMEDDRPQPVQEDAQHFRLSA